MDKRISLDSIKDDAEKWARGITSPVIKGEWLMRYINEQVRALPMHEFDYRAVKDAIKAGVLRARPDSERSGDWPA